MTKYLEGLRRRRTELIEGIRTLSDAAADEGRALTEAEGADVARIDAEIVALDEDIAVHQRLADRAEAARAADAQAADAMRTAEAAGGGVPISEDAARRLTVTDPPVYGPGNGDEFLLDTYRSALHGDMGVRAAAAEKLGRHQRQRADEDEAVRVSTTANFGADGGLVPPAYITSMIAELPRGGKPFVDAIPKIPMPDRGNMIHLPQEAITGEVGPHTENAAVVNTEGTATDHSIGVVQVAGRWTTTRQALDRGVGVSDLVWRSLADRYDEKYDGYLLNGLAANNEPVGVLNDAATTSVVWTDANPTFAEFWPMWRKVVGDLWDARKRPPTLAVWAPKLWTWVSSQLDTTNRPLVLGRPDIAYNPVALGDAVDNYGVMGQSQGLNILVDANMPTKLGVGNNETAVIVTRPTDLVLMETPTMSIMAEQSKIDNLNVDFVLYGYIAFSSGWQSKSSAKLTGTGMVLT